VVVHRRERSNISAGSWREEVKFNEMIMTFALYSTKTLNWICIVLLH
jgi:hypothetical protein